MRTYINLLLFFIIGITSFAGEFYPEQPDYTLISKLEDSGLKIGRTKVIFQLNGIEPSKGTIKVVWSANKLIDTVTLTNRREISQTLISGKYNFKFYYNSIYREIIIPRIILESGYCFTISLNFKPERRENITVKKPVIYLYPEKEMDVNVLVKPTGEMSFTYPEYTENGWDVHAKPSGELMIGDQAYNYLFWESEQNAPSLNTESGFIISKEYTVAFLEETLDRFGLNSKEKADFITFWGPQLLRNDRNFIRFQFNEECNSFAELSIYPQPAKVYRIYLLFTDDSKIEDSKGIIPQIIPQIERTGFTVVEWGGSEIPLLEM